MNAAQKHTARDASRKKDSDRGSHRLPFGSLHADDLYDEELARVYRKGTHKATILCGAAACCLVAAWAFACMPAPWDLAISWVSDLHVNGIPLALFVYGRMRNIAPVFLFSLGIILCMRVVTHTLELRIQLFYDELPPSVTVFRAEDDESPNRPSRQLSCAALALVALGIILLWAATSAALPFWPNGTWLMHIFGCTSLAAGCGITAGLVAHATLTDRGSYIDAHDLLVPFFYDADQAFLTRLYADHAHGVATLTGKAAALLAITCLITRLPFALGVATIPSHLAATHLMRFGSGRLELLLDALRRTLPLCLLLISMSMVAKAFFRHQRFMVQWPFVEVPSYPDKYPELRHSMLTRASLLSAVCIGIYALIKALTWWSYGTLSPADIPVPNSTVNALVLLGSLAMLACGGGIVSQLVEHMLLGKSSYAVNRYRRRRPDECEVVFGLLDGCRATRYVTVITLYFGLYALLAFLCFIICGLPITDLREVAFMFLTRFHLI